MDKTQSANDLSVDKLVKGGEDSGVMNLWPLVIRMISFFFIKFRYSSILDVAVPMLKLIIKFPLKSDILLLGFLVRKFGGFLLYFCFCYERAGFTDGTGG